MDEAAPPSRGYPFSGPHLVGVAGDHENRIVPFLGDAVVIGRDPECEIPVDEDAVAQRHAEVRRDPERGFLVRDLGSANGTFLNGAKVQEHPLAPDDRVSVDEHEFLFIDPERSTTDLGARPLRYLATTVVGCLTPVRGQEGPTCVLEGQTTTMGSGTFNDVVVADDTVSTNHCKVKDDDGIHTVVDLRSTNGTWVNGVRVEQEARLRPGDELGVGRVVFRFSLARRQRPKPRIERESRGMLVLLLLLGLFALLTGSFLCALAVSRLMGTPEATSAPKVELQRLWCTAEDGARLGPVLADLDGDGVPEVAAAGPGREIVCREGPLGRTLWSFRATGEIVGLCALGAAPGGSPGAVFAATDGGLHALDAEGRQRWESPYGELLGDLVGPPVLVPGARRDLDRLTVATDAGRVLLLARRDGTSERTLPGLPASLEAPPVFVHLGASGPAALVLLDHEGRLHAQGVDGSTLWTATTTLATEWPPTAADLDGDGFAEVVAPEAGRTALAVMDGRTGRTLLVLRLASTVAGRPLAVDVDPRPGRELLVPLASGEFAAYRYPEGDSLFVTARRTDGATALPPALADADGDGREDLLVACPSGDLVVFGGRDGRVLASAKLAAPPGGGVAVGDVSGRSRLEVVVRLGDGRLEAFTTNRPLARGSCPWPAPWGEPGGGGRSVSP